jgi:hypothetical protein
VHRVCAETQRAFFEPPPQGVHPAAERNIADAPRGSRVGAPRSRGRLRRHSLHRSSLGPDSRARGR